MIIFLIARDALLPIYRIKRKNIKGTKIHIVIGGFFLLADAILRGSSVYTITIKTRQAGRRPLPETGADSG